MATASVSETLLKRDLAHIGSRPRRGESQSAVEATAAGTPHPAARPAVRPIATEKSWASVHTRASEGALSTVTWAIAHTGGRSGGAARPPLVMLAWSHPPTWRGRCRTGGRRTAHGHRGLARPLWRTRVRMGRCLVRHVQRAGPALLLDLIHLIDRHAPKDRLPCRSARESSSPQRRGRATVTCSSPVKGGEGRSSETAAPRTARRDRRGRQRGVR
jgi:hypothetical protein